MKRPLTQAHIARLADTNIAIVENNQGVAASWYMADSSAASAQYGLIGALVSAGMDAMMNAGPAGRAQQTADDLATIALADKLNQSLRAQFDAMKVAQAPDGSGVRIAEVSTVQKILSPAAVNDAVEVNISYTLSEDATALNIVATAAYSDPAAKYVTPYTFKTVPKDELDGPLYRNSFVYESNRFALPTLGPEIKQAMVEAIQKKYIAKTGSLPVSANAARRSRYSAPLKESKDYEDMSQEIKEANDNTLSKSEAAGLLTREWLKADGAFLLKELESAHAYIAKYVLLDLNSTAVPSLEGADQVVEQMQDGRTVRLVGAGIGAGTYVSSPGGLKDFTTFGNAIQIADVHRKKISQLQETAKKQSAKR